MPRIELYGIITGLSIMRSYAPAVALDHEAVLVARVFCTARGGFGRDLIFGIRGLKELAIPRDVQRTGILRINHRASDTTSLRSPR